MEKLLKTFGRVGLVRIAVQEMDMTFNPIFTRVLSKSIGTGVNTSIPSTLVVKLY